MRLIDGDRLIKVIEKAQFEGSGNIMSIINDAPTVEYPESITIKCDMEEDKQKLLSALRNASARLEVHVEEERPKGEWIKETDEHLEGMYRCSVCGRRVDGSVLDDLLMIDEDYTISDCYPFCHCGAEMGKEAENDDS